MKKFQTLLAIAVGGALLNVAVTASADDPKNGYATVIRIRGEASYSLDNGAHRFPLVAGKYLDPGATIYTGIDGQADIVLGKAVSMPQAAWVPQRISLAPDSPVRGFVGYEPSVDQNVIRLMPNSALAIDKLTTVSAGADTVSDTELDLKKGTIYASVKKLSPAAQYLVKTPTGIAGVRGTQFSISLNEDGTIKDVVVYKTHDDDGLVLAITSPNGSTQTFLIKDGEIYEAGSPNPVPITPQLRSLLQQAFASVNTSYYQLVSFNYDLTQYRTSTDFGF
jgi:hypothetical protein